MCSFKADFDKYDLTLRDKEIQILISLPSFDFFLWKTKKILNNNNIILYAKRVDDLAPKLSLFYTAKITKSFAIEFNYKKFLSFLYSPLEPFGLFSKLFSIDLPSQKIKIRFSSLCH